MKTWPILQVFRERKCSPLSYISDSRQLYKTISDVKPRILLPSEVKPRADPSGKTAASTSHQDKGRTCTAQTVVQGQILAGGYAQPTPCLGKVQLLTWTNRRSLHRKVEEKTSSPIVWPKKNTRASRAQTDVQKNIKWSCQKPHGKCIAMKLSTRDFTPTHSERACTWTHTVSSEVFISAVLNL